MIDLPATLLEFFGVERPPDMLGMPLREAVASNQPVREVALFGMHGAHINITDGRYVYMLAPANPHNTPLYNYTVMATHMRHRFTVEELQQAELAPPFSFTKGCPVLKIPGRRWAGTHAMETLLYDVENDPHQQQLLDDPATEERLRQQMIRLMQENDAPVEQYERLGLMLPV